jgi:hypothetical protein
MTERSIGSKRKACTSPPDELPSECDYGDCDETPTHRLQFKNPDDNLYYCKEHKSHCRNLPGQRWAREL